MRILDYIESLGWGFSEYWNNRAIYTLDKCFSCPYRLFEHQGKIGIVCNGDWSYYNLKDEEINQFTKALKDQEKILHNPNEYTVSELFNAYENLNTLLGEFNTAHLKNSHLNPENNERNNYDNVRTVLQA